MSSRRGDCFCSRLSTKKRPQHVLASQLTTGCSLRPGDLWRSFVIEVPAEKMLHFYVVRLDQPESHPGRGRVSV